MKNLCPNCGVWLWDALNEEDREDKQFEYQCGNCNSIIHVKRCVEYYTSVVALTDAQINFLLSKLTGESRDWLSYKNITEEIEHYVAINGDIYNYSVMKSDDPYSCKYYTVIIKTSSEKKFTHTSENKIRANCMAYLKYLSSDEVDKKEIIK